jgi:hypothetical protein
MSNHDIWYVDYGYPTISQNPYTVHCNALSGSVIISIYKYNIQIWPWHMAGGCPFGNQNVWPPGQGFV